MKQIKICPICETDEVAVKHHVIPVSKAPRGFVHLPVSPVLVCMDCGNQVHMLYTNKELASFGSLIILCAQSDMIKYIGWKKKHPGEHAYKASRKLREWKAFHHG
jgi:hypothetical protein